MGGEFAVTAGVLRDERAWLLHIGVAALAVVCSVAIVALGVVAVPDGGPVGVVAQLSPSRLVVTLDAGDAGALKVSERVTVVTGDGRTLGTVVATAGGGRTVDIALAAPVRTSRGAGLFVEFGRTTVARLIVGGTR